MKKFTVVVIAAAMLSTVAFGAYSTTEMRDQMVTGQTANWSNIVWKTTGGVTSVLPWAGTMDLYGLGGTEVSGQWRQETTINHYGAVVNSDAGTNLGDGTVAGYNGTTPIYNSTLKLNVKNGTFNLAGQTLWTDKVQNGTASRTSFGTDSLGNTYYGKSVMNIGQNGALRVSTAGQIQLGYGASSDTYLKLLSNGVLSGLKTDSLGNVVAGGSSLELGRNQASHMVDFELNGSAATCEVGYLKMNQMASNTSILRWVTDAGGVTSIDCYGTGQAVIMGVTSKIDLQLGAVPTMGDVLTIVNLVDGAATIGAGGNAGKFKKMDGTTLVESAVLRAVYGNNVGYYYQISYKGGTGNDVTLTLIPEPATIGLLSLGGLAMFRRRRA